jgi:hypothetical protein
MKRLGLCAAICALAASGACGQRDPLDSGNGGLTKGDGGTPPSTQPTSPPTGVMPVPPATNPPTGVMPANPPINVMPANGVGPTLGGCPGPEPAADSACATPGRLCKWTRSCGAGGVVGWCTPSKTWKVVVPTCQPGCPAFPPGETVGSQFGPPPDAKCVAGLECRYPSSPIQGGTIYHCVAQPDGRTIWPLPASLKDGWVPASGRSDNGCGELTACSGVSGCGSTCPNPEPKACYCGPDGLQYCEVHEACGGGTVTTKPGP